MVIRYGIRASLATGLAFVAAGLLLLARAPIEGMFMVDILPSMILLGLGAGISFNPMLLAAMSDVPEHESGLASGLVNTAFMMGGALGLAILASLAAFRTEKLLALGRDQIVALNSGYHIAFLVGAIFAGLAAVVVGVFLRTNQHKKIDVD